ncbi:hypothetical protein EBU58_00665 [bacterium]|nr:hypothetical protein [bacterium]
MFTDAVQLLTGLAVGHGGVWLCCPPQILFIPDADGDLVPDGPAEVVLDGFDVGPSSHHNFANGLAFGPDGWLYGRCGHSCPARIGAPGTPDNQRLPMEGGMWRYHVGQRRAEVLTTGTTNPWGHDWTAEGECFFVNTVNGHLWHLIPGAHFAQANGVDPNPLTYELIDQHADHYHFDTGAGWQASRDGAANSLGGGHAHSGCLIYEGDGWPEAYRGQLFTLNFHGRRINQERLERAGSGYVAHHQPDFAVSSDTWFRGLELSARPDGSVVVLDWSDTGECHEHDGVHRSSGRLYSIRHRDQPQQAEPVDLVSCSTSQLVMLQRSRNRWEAQQARLVLAERATSRSLEAAMLEPLVTQLHDAKAISSESGLSQSTLQVRALLTLHLCHAVDRQDLIELCQHRDEHVRTWAVRLLTESWPLDAALGPVVIPPETAARVADESHELLPMLVSLASEDASGLVRLAVASTLQRLPLPQRAELAKALVARSEDATDHNLPLLVWYGLIPLADTLPKPLAEVAVACQWPTTRRLITRRLTERILETALEAVALDRSAALTTREAAVRSLEQAVRSTHASDATATLRRVCEKLSGDRYLTAAAANGLAAFNDRDAGDRIVEALRRAPPPRRDEILSLLVSRSVFAEALLAAVDKNRIAADWLSAYHIRQLHALNNEQLTAEADRLWGRFAHSSADLEARIEAFRSKLATAAPATTAELSHGRELYQKLCSSCHRLYGVGGDLGPDLTGSGRHELSYLAENILNPSGVVNRDWRLSVLEMEDGRVLSGVVTDERERTLTLITPTQKRPIDRQEIAAITPTDRSPMPEGLLDPLSDEEIRDLVAYLRSPVQVPLP